MHCGIHRGSDGAGAGVHARHRASSAAATMLAGKPFEHAASRLAHRPRRLPDLRLGSARIVDADAKRDATSFARHAAVSGGADAGARRPARDRRAAASRGCRCCSGCSALTAGLLGVAVQQLRREHELARLRARLRRQRVARAADAARADPPVQRDAAARPRAVARRRRGARWRSSSRNRGGSLISSRTFSISRAAERGDRAAVPRSPARLAALAAELVEAFGRSRVRGRSHRRVAGARRRGRARRRRRAAADPAEPARQRGEVRTAGPDVSRWASIGARTSAVITVDDQGPGVPPDARERIWEPYSRLAPASATPSRVPASDSRSCASSSRCTAGRCASRTRRRRRALRRRAAAVPRRPTATEPMRRRATSSRFRREARSCRRRQRRPGVRPAQQPRDRGLCRPRRGRRPDRAGAGARATARSRHPGPDAAGPRRLSRAEGAARGRAATCRC